MSALGAPRAYGAGLVALDLLISANPASPIQAWAGGTCGNVLSILSYLGWDTYPIARLGDDATSQRIENDLSQWGVKSDFLRCAPTNNAPIVIQQNEVRNGTPRHRFSWVCPQCGNWLPSFRPITREAVSQVSDALVDASVFFMDRLSRGTLELAQRAASLGALVVFEPSGRSDPKLFAEALTIAHVVKYADQRLSDAGGTMNAATATVLEIQTLGARGLRFRHKLTGAPSEWEELPAVDAEYVVDTCGAGDWCTAGLLSRTASRGLQGFTDLSVEDLSDALVHGQALAAWNCGFEGARGAMYASKERVFTEILHGLAENGDSVAELCPACPTVA